MSTWSMPDDLWLQFVVAGRHLTTRWRGWQPQRGCCWCAWARLTPAACSSRWPAAMSCGAASWASGLTSPGVMDVSWVTWVCDLLSSGCWLVISSGSSAEPFFSLTPSFHIFLKKIFFRAAIPSVSLSLPTHTHTGTRTRTSLDSLFHYFLTFLTSFLSFCLCLRSLIMTLIIIYIFLEILLSRVARLPTRTVSHILIPLPLYLSMNKDNIESAELNRCMKMKALRCAFAHNLTYL